LDDDPLSQFCIHTLEREGVDCSALLHQAGARPIHAYIVVDATTGSRTILFTTAGSQMLPAARISEKLVLNSKALLVDMMSGEAGLHAARIARRHGIPVVGDLENLQYPFASQVIAEVDHLILGRAFAAELSGCTEPAESATALAAQPGRACAVVTAGAQGCWYSADGQAAQRFPAFPVTAVNTTGCGDVFHGAYAASLVRGDSLEQRIKIASAAAALKAASSGGVAGIPHRTEVDAFLQSSYHESGISPQGFATRE
jgi:sugar/nucleoside kinase (ribokinase family)